MQVTGTRKLSAQSKKEKRKKKKVFGTLYIEQSYFLVSPPRKMSSKTKWKVTESKDRLPRNRRTSSKKKKKK